jgi:hypothetical protein
MTIWFLLACCLWAITSYAFSKRARLTILWLGFDCDLPAKRFQAGKLVVSSVVPA